MYVCGYVCMCNICYICMTLKLQTSYITACQPRQFIAHICYLHTCVVIQLCIIVTINIFYKHMKHVIVQITSYETVSSAQLRRYNNKLHMLMWTNNTHPISPLNIMYIRWVSLKFSVTEQICLCVVKKKVIFMILFETWLLHLCDIAIRFVCRDAI
jgi:hypothetical protein